MKGKVYKILAAVKDPEIPVLTLEDLGVIRDVNVLNDDEVEVKITPTYTGCPATDVMEEEIRLALFVAGFSKIRITQVISPAWTTDWLSQKGREKLIEYGIAPPVEGQAKTALLEDISVPCPRCGSEDTKMISAFGSTACKALFQCQSCREPFDYFKCHA